MDGSTKSSRRIRWQNYNFAGTIDWALDLQAFSDEDKTHIPDRPEDGQGCISGEDDTLNTADLCAFSCTFGFCPETLCTCVTQGDLQDLPAVKFNGEIEAWLPNDVEINRLCTFACKYGYCPSNVCIPPVIDEVVNEDNNTLASDLDNLPTRDKMQQGKCVLWKGITENDQSVKECKSYCAT
jgi:hypothetical protein